MTAALDMAVRSSGIGASEIAAVAGISPYATALDIFLRKLGLVGDSADNPHTRWGLRLEPAIALAYEDETGIPLAGDGRATLRHAEHEWMLATPDRIAVDRSRLVEIKTAGVWQKVWWGEPGTDSVPEHYLTQVAWQMGVVDVDVADIAVLIEGHDFRVYTVERDRELERQLIEIGREFWHENVLAGVPPEATSADSLSRYLSARYPRNTAPLKQASEQAERLAAALKETRFQKAFIEDEEDRLVCALKAEIGESDGLITSIGEITWRAPKESGTVDWKAVALACQPAPDLIARNTRARKNTRRFLTKFS